MVTEDTEHRVDTETIEAAAGAIDEISNGTGPATITLSNGLVLGIKPVPPYLIQKAAATLKAPVVPKIFLDDKGREEENPGDPAYQEALLAYNIKVADAGANVMLGAGTAVVELGPDMEGPDGPTWADTLEFFGVEFNHSSQMSRYITWLTCYALPTASDLQLAVTAVAKRTGISEEEAAEALASFRDRTLRRTDNSVPPEAT